MSWYRNYDTNDKAGQTIVKFLPKSCSEASTWAASQSGQTHWESSAALGSRSIGPRAAALTHHFCSHGLKLPTPPHLVKSYPGSLLDDSLLTDCCQSNCSCEILIFGWTFPLQGASCNGCSGPVYSLTEQRQLWLPWTLISTLAEPKLQSSLNLLNLLATKRNAKREDGISE